MKVAGKLKLKKAVAMLNNTTTKETTTIGIIHNVPEKAFQKILTTYIDEVEKHNLKPSSEVLKQLIGQAPPALGYVARTFNKEERKDASEKNEEFVNWN